MPENKKAAQANTRTAQDTHENDFTPKQPALGTQAARLLAALQSGRTITPPEAWAALAIMRVADTVFKLRGLGWKVDKINITHTNRFGDKVTFASCRLKGMAQ